MKHFLLIGLFSVGLFSSKDVLAQCNPAPPINVINPSFEGSPQEHVTPAPWSVCMSGQTPDTQPGFWGVNVPPSNGSSYIGLIHQPSGFWQEGASQQLSSPMVAGTQYTFTIDLANSSSNIGGIIPGCVECVIYGGYGPCDQNNVLWRSGNISVYDQWTTYTVNFTPAQNFTWILIQALSLGCTDGPYLLVDNISSIQPQPITLTPTVIQPNCTGISTGSAYMSYSGGTAPYTFLWSNGVSTQSNPNLFAGTYGITATDANGCTSVASIDIVNPDSIAITPVINPEVCGNGNGSVTANITNGTGPFTYLWSNGQTTPTISGLVAGIYTVTVTTANQCTGTASANVASSSGINVNFNTVDEDCGTVNGSVIATATGGNGNFTYLWSTGENSPGLSNLSTGTYILTVTSNGCTEIATAFVGTTGSLGLSTTSVDAGCSSTGSVSVNVTFGGGPYTYLWNNGDTTQTANGLSAGTYTVSVTGANGCSGTASTSINASGNGVTLVPSSVNTTCGNNNGIATVNITSGTAPFTYSWSNGGASSSLSNLSGGTYIVTVTGAGNCTATAIFNIASSSGVTLTTTATSTNCGSNNGTATVSASGGSGIYDFLWSNGSNLTALANLAPGTYTVTVTDNLNCSATASVDVIGSGQGTVNITTDKSVMCSGDSAQLCAPVGYSSYLWNTGQTGRCITTQLAGNYYVTVTDAGSCTASSNRITINVHPSPPVSITVNGDTLTAYNAVTYQWYYNEVAIAGATSNVHIAQQNGNYTVAVTDSNGCRAVSTKISIIKTDISDLAEVAFVNVYPNPLQMGYWVVETSQHLIGARIEIFDDNGRLVYHSVVREVKSEIPLEVASGIYMLRITSDKSMLTRKLIKL